MESLSWLCTVLALGMGRGGGGGKQWSNWSLDYTQLYPLSPPHSLYTPIYSLSWLLKAEAQHCFWPTPVLYIFAGMTVRFSLREYICTEVFFFFFLLPCLRVPQVYTHIHAHTHTLSLSVLHSHTSRTHTHTHTHTQHMEHFGACYTFCRLILHLFHSYCYIGEVCIYVPFLQIHRGICTGAASYP